MQPHLHPCEPYLCVTTFLTGFDSYYSSHHLSEQYIRKIAWYVSSARSVNNQTLSLPKLFKFACFQLCRYLSSLHLCAFSQTGLSAALLFLFFLTSAPFFLTLIICSDFMLMILRTAGLERELVTHADLLKPSHNYRVLYSSAKNLRILQKRGPTIWYLEKL